MAELGAAAHAMCRVLRTGLRTLLAESEHTHQQIEPSCTRPSLNEPVVKATIEPTVAYAPGSALRPLG